MTQKKQVWVHVIGVPLLALGAFAFAFLPCFEPEDGLGWGMVGVLYLILLGFVVFCCSMVAAFYESKTLKRYILVSVLPAAVVMVVLMKSIISEASPPKNECAIVRGLIPFVLSYVRETNAPRGENILKSDFYAYCAKTTNCPVDTIETRDDFTVLGLGKSGLRYNINADLDAIAMRLEVPRKNGDLCYDYGWSYTNEGLVEPTPAADGDNPLGP